MPTKTKPKSSSTSAKPTNTAPIFKAPVSAKSKSKPKTSTATKTKVVLPAPKIKEEVTPEIKLDCFNPPPRHSLTTLNESKILEADFLDETEFTSKNKDISEIDEKIDILFEKKRKIQAMIDALCHTKKEFQVKQMMSCSL